MPVESKKTVLSSRESLIEAATDLFQKKGYFATGVNDILAVTGLPKGSFYHHFRGGKADLAATCVEALCDKVVAYIDRAMKNELEIAEVFDLFVVHSERWLKQNHWSGGSLFSTLSHEVTTEDVALRRSLKESYQRMQSGFAQLLGKQGLTPTWAEVCALNILLAFEGALSLSAATQDIQPLKSAEQMLLAMLKNQDQ